MQEFLNYMNKTMTSMAELLGETDNCLFLSLSQENTEVEEAYDSGDDYGRTIPNYDRTIPIFKDNLKCPTHKFLLGWRRRGKSVRPNVLERFAMDEVDQLLRTCYIPFNASDKWFPDDLGLGYHTPASLGEYLYSRTCRQVAKAYEWTAGLQFSLVEKLAAQTYESEETGGSLVFLPGGRRLPDDSFFARFSSNPPTVFQESEVRLIRKLLAGLDRHHNALCFRRVQGDYQCDGYIYYTDEAQLQWPHIAVNFQKRKWVFRLNGYPVFQSCGGALQVIQKPVEHVISQLNEEFGADCKRYGNLLRAISAQEHGTSFIFVDLGQAYSRDWMNRLSHQRRTLPVTGIDIANMSDWEESCVQKLSRVDGAYVVDVRTDTICFLFMLVDGLAVVKARADAGARYNSLYTWVANLVMGESCASTVEVAAVVRSEDGGMKTILGKNVRRELLRQGHGAGRYAR